MKLSIKEKITLAIGSLVTMIIGLVALSVISLQILTFTEPNSPVAGYGLSRAMTLVVVFGVLCILIGLWIWIKLPVSINKPFEELTMAIKEVANHHYDVSLDLKGSEAMEMLSGNFNSMVHQLNIYKNSSTARLMTSKKYLETIINSIDEPIICLDRNLSFLFINNEALGILNINRESTENQSAQEMALRNDLLRRLLNGLKSQKDKKDEPLKIYADNKESYFQVKYLPVRMTNPDDKRIEQKGYVVYLKNITEFHKLNVAKTTFISTISHELKTPISAILMSSQLLTDNRIGSLNADQQEMIKDIKDNGERLLSITGELLNMTQVESGALQLKPIVTKPIELIEYAIKANKLQADKFGINIEVDYPAHKIGKLYVDSEKIAWVLTNLLSNAIRYSPEGGRVIIGAKQSDEHHIAIFVQDFGKGIDPRYHESIFEKYFRVPGTKIQGSGLGLSISRDFVEAHNGTLVVESELGKGSRFIMTLSVCIP
ncbi:MAG: ATP-binding protein [Prevotella sp.]|jgi:signal transduction histidine kinase